ncbi:RIKEN cDNA 2610040C18, isoform CRA_b [Mus musculus]|uniref:Centromere protein S n=1 Tax=Mus musculus TaxID=10090 RepID=A6PWQ2_MOUSE|nr:RIKEN cDNA 2610040C18, isoform CRA_b [Mus musculus]
MEEVEAEEPQEFSHRQRLKAAVHYTVGCLCQEVTLNKQVNFSKQTIAAISEVTFRQCENFAKDLEMFARNVQTADLGILESPRPGTLQVCMSLRGPGQRPWH